MVMIITSLIIIYQGYNIKKQEQIDIHTHRYLKGLFRSHRDIIKNKFIENPINILRDDENLNLNEEPPSAPNSSNAPRPPKPPEDFSSLRITKEELNNQLEKYDMEVANILYSDLQMYGKLIAQDEEWKLYEYNGYYYFYYLDRFREILVKDTIKENEKTLTLISLTILLNMVFISFYIFLIKKLIPLGALKNNIKLFSKGNLFIDTSTKGKDEISEVSNEFNNAITQIRHLSESRNLFLRNIMHELKTPIARGFIIADMLEDNKYHKNLKKAFERLEYLLSELARLEILTSNNLKLKKDEFRIIDILDNSLDILLLDKEAIDLKIDTDKTIFVNADFEFFSVAVKNLIDNALKYGQEKPLVVVNEKFISVSNQGDKLTKPLNEYFKPFNRSYESSSKSLGLGLYIIHSILKAHGYKLEYSHKNGDNIFLIHLKSA